MVGWTGPPQPSWLSAGPQIGSVPPRELSGRSAPEFPFWRRETSAGVWSLILPNTPGSLNGTTQTANKTELGCIHCLVRRRTKGPGVATRGEGAVSSHQNYKLGLRRGENGIAVSGLWKQRGEGGRRLLFPIQEWMGLCGKFL